jgi:hypothetical protein
LTVHLPPGAERIKNSRGTARIYTDSKEKRTGNMRNFSCSRKARQRSTIDIRHTLRVMRRHSESPQQRSKERFSDTNIHPAYR